MPDGTASVSPAEVAPSSAATSASGRAVRGGFFTLGGSLAVQGLRMGGNIVLTRLLPPEAFGLMAIVHSFRAAIDLFSDIGIGPSIVQNERGDDPKFLNTAWTIQVFRGTCLFIVTSALALPMAHFYEQPLLATLIPIASISALLAGLQSTKGASSERHLELGRPMLIEIAAQCSALGTMVVWALYSPSVWALVGGGLVGAVVDVVLNHSILRGYNGRLGWDAAAARSLLRFGKWIFVSTLLTYAVNEADRLIFGKLTTLGDLGIYHVALMIAGVPTGAMYSLAAKVMFPLFSRVRNTGEDLGAVFRKARRLHLVFSGWALSGLIGGGQAAIGLVYEGPYEEGGWMLQVLAVAAWIATPDQTNSCALLASGSPRWLAAANFGKLVGMVALIPLGYAVAGFPGALVAYAASGLFRYVVFTTGVYRHGLRTLSQDLGMGAVVAVAALAGYGCVQLLSGEGVHVVLQCLAVFVVVTLIWLPWLLPYLRDAVARLRQRGRAES